MKRTFEVLAPAEPAPSAGSPFHSWQAPGREPWLTFHRSGEGFLLRFPGFADYLLSADGSSVRCIPSPDADRETIDYLYDNQIAPLADSLAGDLAFHGSAVEIDEVAVAFLGPTGRGKSTLATSFALEGHRFLTDDLLLLRVEDDVAMARPSHPSVRMWEDSRLALLGADAEHTPAARHTTKARFTADDRLAHCPVDRPLRAAFFLTDEVVDTTRFEEVRGMERLSRWLPNLFVLDVCDKERARRAMGEVGELTDRVRSFAFSYPRQYDLLPRVRRDLMSFVRNLT